MSASPPKSDASGVAVAPTVSTPALAAPPAVDPSELDTWLAIARDGRVTAFFGKPDIGLGVDTAIIQIVAEELDVSPDQVELVMADTALTCNQGGVSGSVGIQRGAVPLRNAAAEARAILLGRAAEKLGAPVERLQVDSGVVSVAGEPARRIAYGELVDGRFNHRLEWNGQFGNGLLVTGKAKPKSPDQYRIVGASIPRREVTEKVFGRFPYLANFKRPGMIHGRVIRPPVAGARPVSVDEASIAHIPTARVVRKVDFIGVVADDEWSAVRASRALRVTWSEVKPPFPPHTRLFDHIRAAQPARTKMDEPVGDVAAAFAKGGQVVEAEYEWPFQSHACLAPACAVAEVTAEGATIWHASQKTHAANAGLAGILGLPVEKVRSIGMTGPGSYGRNDAGDAAADAAVMSQITGRPVRVQGARSEGHGWDPKAAASIHRVHGLLGPDGKLEAYHYMSKGFSKSDVATAESGPHDMLAGMLLGFDNPPVHSFTTPADAYEIPNRQMGWETIDTLLRNDSPLRTSHLRDPLGPQLHFASESFIDECALAAGADPMAFRLRHLKDARHIAAIEAAAEKASWKPGAPGARRGRRGSIMTGTGFACTSRGGTIVAMVVEVEVDSESGRVWPRRFVVAHDCGLIVNPKGLTLCIEGNIIHSTSRALFEEVTFDERNVTSVDWLSYPILDIMDAPEAIDHVLINRPELPPTGAGEPSSRPTAAAIANAIFDATGARLRRVPFTPDRVKAALTSASRP